ncbi:hypothetical protein M878_37100 [Streptomyces roseochromogenus subsp. oscitans DS 12.976]|uniref:Uncharacterized protein n=1 Tax=Streptomyces roseochromogenus subsp. oscitans DS 12.976 TaxID=1352936 RepID=V6JQV6_STRRC|nr:hypothetical protein M878_37100 [Streptomyces roseochromogenus subsp. oscitans DS 12.976]
MSATMAIRMRASERPGLLWALALRPLLGAATFSYSLSGRSALVGAVGHDMVSGCFRTGNRRPVVRGA